MKSSSFAAVGLLLLLVAPCTLHAQYVGLSTGRTSSTVYWVPLPTDPGESSPHDRRDGVAPAIAAQWRAASWLGVASELRYTMKGFDTTEPTVHVDYLEVPLLLRVGRLTDARSVFTFFGEVGPALAIRANCRLKVNEDHGTCRKVQYSSDTGTDFRVTPVDVSGVLGIGGALRVRSAVVIVGARRDWGAINMGSWTGDKSLNRSNLVYVAVLWKRGGVE